eukprot:jgi/Mesvir1/27188/Mv07766-RA.1
MERCNWHSLRLGCMLGILKSQLRWLLLGFLVSLYFHHSANALQTQLAWAGAVTDVSALVVATTSVTVEQLELGILQEAPGGFIDVTSTSTVTRENAALQSPDCVASGYTACQDTVVVHRFMVTGLEPSTRYQYYFLYQGSDVDNGTLRGNFRTFPAQATPANFSLTMASCAESGSNHPVFDALAEEEALMFIHMGDLHYSDINTNSSLLFASAYHKVFRNSRQVALFRSKPIAYIYDDHDFGPNDADKRAKSRGAALEAYRAFVPHYPLGDPTPGSAVYQSFEVGRVRIIITDLRANRDRESDRDSGAKTLLGTAQKAWFKDQLASAASKGSYVLWVSTVPWAGSDSGWSPYATEQKELADVITAHALRGRMMIVAGDAHMLAFDDGRHSAGEIPVLQAAALDKLGSCKGGPYSHGIYQGGKGRQPKINFRPNRDNYGGGNYGKISIVDFGGDVRNHDF